MSQTTDLRRSFIFAQIILEAEFEAFKALQNVLLSNQFPSHAYLAAEMKKHPVKKIVDLPLFTDHVYKGVVAELLAELLTSRFEQNGADRENVTAALGEPDPVGPSPGRSVGQFLAAAESACGRYPECTLENLSKSRAIVSERAWGAFKQEFIDKGMHRVRYDLSDRDWRLILTGHDSSAHDPTGDVELSRRSPFLNLLPSMALRDYVRHVVLGHMLPDVVSIIEALEAGSDVENIKKRREMWIRQIETKKGRRRPFSPDFRA